MDRLYEYDYIEMITYDIHTIPRGRLLARRRALSAMKKGLGMYTAMLYLGPLDQRNDCKYFGPTLGHGNSFMVPILDTLVDAPKSACGDYKVGQVLCDFRLADGRLDPTNPRTVAERQIERLASMGLTIKSSHEIEFRILDAQGKVWEHPGLFADMNVIRKTQGVFLEFMEELYASGVKADALQTETGIAEYELNLDIAEGLNGPDMASRFKSVSKVFFQKRDLTASCMSRIFPDNISNTFHFNHSLWNKDGDNVFLDLENPGCLSKIGQHWLAGLITHAPSMTALLCPTFNCYRGLHQIMTPSKSDWKKDNRLVNYRLVTETGNNIFLECRAPTGSCNPYLVMAGVVAAGLDGISRQLSLDDVNQEAAIPRDLESALKLLEDDTILVEALGKEFVDCYTYVKRRHEIDYFKALGPLSDQDMLEEEKKVYLLRF